MFNATLDGWGTFRKINQKVYTLYGIANSRENKNKKKYKERIKKQALEEGYDSVRFLQNKQLQMACYVLEEDDES